MGIIIVYLCVDKKDTSIRLNFDKSSESIERHAEAVKTLNVNKRKDLTVFGWEAQDEMDITGLGHTPPGRERLCTWRFGMQSCANGGFDARLKCIPPY